MGKKKTEKSEHKCGECALKTWLEGNLTNAGELFLLKCPHFKNGETYHFAKDKACEHFKVGKRVTTID